MSRLRGHWIVGALLGLAVELLSIPARLLVPLFAIGGRYPWWMVTPDDPVSPFGTYEATVRAVYARFGRYLGDVYWLAWRNVLYGLSYRLKPAVFKGVVDYTVFATWALPRRGGWLYVCEDYALRQWGIGRFEILAGWMVRGAVLDPLAPRQPVNMEFRPIFSVRRAG
jgi:hypothetical protein